MEREEKDLTGSDWKLEDFGFTSSNLSRTGQSGQGFTSDFTSGISGGFGQRPLKPTDKSLPPGYEIAPVQDFYPEIADTNSAIRLGLVSAQEQAQAKSYLEDQSFFEAAGDRTKTFLSNLFDTEDEKETAVESVWDGFLIGVDWFYDRISQAGALGASLLPGGVRTLSWDEANDVSYGQVMTANSLLLQQEAEEGNPLAGAFGALTNPTYIPSLMIDKQVVGEDFDIMDPEDRKRVFQEDTVGKWTSGLTDAVFTVVADPLIIGGKALKAARIRWVDRPIVSSKQVDELVGALQDDVNKIAVNNTENLSVYGKFLNWVGEVDDTGKRVRSIDDVYNHPVIADATSRDELTALLYNADNFEERSLVMRIAYGDRSARQGLLERRADLAEEWGRNQRTRLTTLMAYKPDQAGKIKAYYGKKANQSQEELDALIASNAPQESIDLARVKRDQLLSVIDDMANGKLIRDPVANPVSKEEIQFARTVMDTYVRRDEYLRKAIENEYAGALQSTTRGFSVNNRFGKVVEASRQRRAEAITDSQGATVKSIWTSEEYSPLGKVGAAVRLWRWAGNEKPAGYIATKGPGATESFREIRANLNNVSIYSGNAKVIKIGDKSVEIGGRQRKEVLMQRYFDAVGSSVDDQNKMALAVNALEEQIIKDIAAWHKMTPTAAKELLYTSQRKRSELIKDIREGRGFWVDESGKKNKVPYLETHLQNGTYLLNFRALENAVALQAKSGNVQRLNQAAAYGGEKLASFYDAFNSVWRPAVLLRLGYTQRNVAEGLFRSSAFLGSLAPLMYAGKQTGLIGRNAIAKKTVAREADRVEAIIAASTPTELPGRLAGSKYAKWKASQLAVLEDRILKEQQWIDETKRLLDDMDPASPDFSINQRNIRWIENNLEDLKADRSLLDSDVTGVAYYRAQASQKRRVFDGEYERTDPYVSYKAFGNPNYSAVAWQNMSADATTRATLALRMETRESIFKNYLQRTYVAVNPNQGDAYFQGVARMLQQYRASEVGKKIINNESYESIALWLRTTPEGKAISRFVNGKEFDTRDLEGALGYVKTVADRLNALVPNPALRALLNSDEVVFSKNFPDQVKKLLDTDDYRNMLVPAIGNVAVETGFKGVRETFNTATNKAFEILGTLPEDAFVRAPFYGRRYQDTRDILLAQINDQYKGKTVPFEEIARAERIAHRRALKDTKKWLYTIERRTNLGHYGEWLIPFISATQNSITALGRLTWKDPSLIGVVNLLWQAPNRAGLEDENGNIVIPLPEELLPDGLAETFGLDNMRNIKISKGSLNVVFPETGFGFVPRPGPIVGAPASELMKTGFFGLYTVDTPDWAKWVFGEEGGTQFWDNYKKYIFGEQDGVSPENLSWDMLFPPAAAKVVQMLQGEGGSTSYAYMYNLQYRTEMMRVLAGERDAPVNMQEFRDEIKNKTNGLFTLRILGNLTAFTPPQYESTLQPLVDTLRAYEKKYPNDGTRMFNEHFGPMLAMIGDFKVAKNVAGVQATASTVANSRKYANIIESVAPGIQNDLGVLGLLLNDNPDALYDNSAYAWQTTTKIPGLNRTYRELQNPEQAFVESQKNAGWTEFISFMDSLDAILQQRGLSSYRAAGARDLSEMKKQFIEKMRNNPLYTGWYNDYIDFGSTRTLSAVQLMETALRDPQFVQDKVGDPVWESAAQYLELRRDVVALVQASGSGINSEVNKQVRELWDTKRQELINQSTKWATISNRYLNGDDDPTAPGITLDQILMGGA